MKLHDYAIVFIGVGLIGVLLIASPAITGLISPSTNEPFTQLYLLGPSHMIENYPFNIAVGQNYTVYLGVANHMGASTYYLVYLKFRNMTDSAPNTTTGTPSTINPLYEYKFIVPSGQTWETLVNFSFTNASTSGNQSLVNSLCINGVSYQVDKPSAWDANATTFPYQLLFELWAYNSQSGQFSYNDREVDLNLNLTSTLP